MNTRRKKVTAADLNPTTMQTTNGPRIEPIIEPPADLSKFVIVQFNDGFLSERIATQKEIKSGRLKFISDVKVLVKVKEETYEGVIILSGGKIYFWPTYT